MTDVYGLTDRDDGQFQCARHGEPGAAGPAPHSSVDNGTSTQAIWLKTWLATYAPDGEVHVGGATLLQRKLGAGPIALVVLNSPTNLQTPRHSVSLDMSSGGTEVRMALNRHRAAGIMLKYLPQDDVEAISNALPGTSLRHLAMPQSAVPVTDCRGTFEQFIERRSKRERQRIRRLVRLADQPDSPLRISLVDGGDQLEAVVEQCLALEHASWKGREGTAILDQPEDAAFYRQLAKSLAAARRLRLALLHDRAGQLVAFEFCMLWDDRLIALKTSCSERHLDLSPGHVLALLHIRHCCADPEIGLYDVTGNGLVPAAHLLRYADQQEWLWRVILFAPNWRGWLLNFLWTMRLRLRSVKRFLT
jgi:Acetyltransferase (GNAT) domain